MIRLPPLERLRAAEAAARLRSFKRAALELGLTPSAVSHRIRALETELGARLFTREGGGVTPTDEGWRLVQSIQDGFQKIQHTWESIQHAVDARPVRVSCATSFASHFLIPNLASFRERRPDLEIQLSSTNALADIERGDCDIGVRALARPDSDLASERLLGVSMIPVAACECLTTMIADGVVRGPLLGISHQPHAWALFSETGAMTISDAASTLWFDSFEAIVSAARRRAGVALLPDWLADEVADGVTLCRVSDTPVRSKFSYWTVMRPADTDNAKLRAVRQWVKACVADRASFEMQRERR